MSHRQPSVMIVALCATLVAAVAAAQSAAPAPPNVAAPQGEQRQSPQATEEVTVTGCLIASPGAGASAATTSSGAGFVLKSAPVAAGQNETPSPSGTASRAPENPSSPGGIDYALQPATPDVKLQPHIGHTIEIKGRAAATADPLSKPQSNEGVSSSQPSGSTGMETIPPPTSRALLVTSIREICPRPPVWT
jgi:hypothetical protein